MTENNVTEAAKPTFPVPYLAVDPHSLYLREEIANGDIDGWHVEFDRAGRQLLVSLSRNDQKIKATIDLGEFVEAFAKELIAKWKLSADA